VALAIFAVCAAPLAAALVSYHFFPPAGRTNYGELVAAKPLPPVRVARLDGRPFSLAELQGKWVMLQADEAACGKPCQAKLFNMRQARLAQGKHMDRVERVWLLVGGGEPSSEIARLYEGAVVARATPELLAALPARDARDHVFLVDPRGNLILRFPPDADPKKMIRDLERLLKYSSTRALVERRDVSRPTPRRRSSKGAACSGSAACSCSRSTVRIR
jgi:cytochrome oxidase Cu insertion factor (SCO1/SenC/PrrC family)